MNIKERVPIRDNPRLFDKAIANIQQGLADNISWLDYVFGRSERLVKMYNGKRVYTPNVYVGGNEYELLEPDSGIGNFCFFVLDEPQRVEYVVGETSEMKVPFSIIVWVDMRTINSEDTRDTESVKRQLLRCLNGAIWMRQGSYRITKVWERAENIFKGFSLDEIDNQFLMHPYCGWRFEGELKVHDDCL